MWEARLLFYRLSGAGHTRPAALRRQHLRQQTSTSGLPWPKPARKQASLFNRFFSSSARCTQSCPVFFPAPDNPRGCRRSASPCSGTACRSPPAAARPHPRRRTRPETNHGEPSGMTCVTLHSRFTGLSSTKHRADLGRRDSGQVHGSELVHVAPTLDTAPVDGAD